MIKVYFQEEIKEFDNSEKGIQTLVEEINTYIKTMNVLFSHLIVDGVKVYENHYQYLLEHKTYAEEIKVVIDAKEKLISGLQHSLNEYLERAIPFIEQIVDQFYQGATTESWKEFADLTDGLQWIMNAVQTLSQYADEEVKVYYLNKYDKLASVLAELMEVVEAQDTVTIADMVQYEIVETLKELKENVHH